MPYATDALVGGIGIVEQVFDRQRIVGYDGSDRGLFSYSTMVSAAAKAPIASNTSTSDSPSSRHSRARSPSRSRADASSRRAQSPPPLPCRLASLRHSPTRSAPEKSC